MKKAFTLLELSVVLVIIGLVTGGVLAGQALIRAAELRAITREVGEYRTAVTAFEDKYNALPGDMVNAKAIWGAQAGTTDDGVDGVCSAMGVGTPATGLPTCNGNGDGYVSLFVPNHEIYRVWHHLKNAGLIEGSFTGVSAGPVATFLSEIGTNVPASRYPQGGWSLWAITNEETTNNPIGNVFVFGSAENGVTQKPVLSPQDAYNVDRKIDDGKPYVGAVTTNWGFIGSPYECAGYVDRGTLAANVFDYLVDLGEDNFGTPVKCVLYFQSGH